MTNIDDTMDRTEGAILLPPVFAQDGRVLCSSVQVAAYFEKQHRHVIRDIKALNCSENFRLSNFGQTVTERPNPSGGAPICSPAYNMTKDGFMFLAMGYTGPKAGRVKELYITAFNRMEEELRRLASAPAQLAAPLLDDERLMARVSTVRLAKQLWGGAVARALWPKLGMQTVPEMASASTREEADPDHEMRGRDCLDHLLAATVGRYTYRHTVARASAGDTMAEKVLREGGVRYEYRMFENEPGILVATRSRALARVFSATRWAGFGWTADLRALPGVRPSTKHGMKFDPNLTSTSVFVPLAHVLGPDSGSIS